jgi:hypothetical protein
MTTDGPWSPPMASMEITSGWVKTALWSFDGSRRIRRGR